MAVAEATTAKLPDLEHDPFAPHALMRAGDQMTRFHALLALVDRTVLPRTLTVETEAVTFLLDVADRRLALLPRRQNGYATDRQMAADAPKVNRLLGKRPQAVYRATDRLLPARPAIERCASRLLWGLAGTGAAQTRISVAAHEDMAAGIQFTPLDLYRAAASQAAPQAASVAATYFEAMKPRMLAGWLATRGGWVMDWPETDDSKAALYLISRISAAARASSGWLDRAGAGGEPSLSFLSGAGHRMIRCLVADNLNVASLQLQPSAWSGALQSWDAICAGPVVAGSPEQL